MKQTRWLSEFSCLTEYTRLYPTVSGSLATISFGVLHEDTHRSSLGSIFMQTAFSMLINMKWSGSLGLGVIVSGMLTIVWAMLLDRFMQNSISMTKTRERSHSH